MIASLLALILVGGYFLLRYVSQQEQERRDRQKFQRIHDSFVRPLTTPPKHQPSPQQRKQEALNRRFLDAATSKPSPPPKSTPKPQPIQESPPPKPKDTTYSYQKSDIPALHRTEVVGVPEQKAAAPKTRFTSSVSSVTKIKLYKLCGDDAKTAERLVSGVRFNNPQQSEQWCWEKAIWDLERDRGR